MPSRWAIDLGTTNTVVASEEEGSVRTMHLPDLCRTLPADQSPLIPSAVHVHDEVRRWLFFRRKVRQVLIGQQAISRNFDGRSPAFSQGFKRRLAGQPHYPALRVGERETLSVREVTRLFLKELLGAIRREYREKPVDLTIPAPVGYYEHYRAELQSVARQLGVQKFRSVDEPVAAALGYGINVTREQLLLVVDWGGGTLNLAAVRLGPQTAHTGRADVLAKHMVDLGGADVDLWLLEHFLGPELKDLAEWERDLLWEAMWMKERVSREGSGEFRWRGRPFTLARAELVELLTRRGLYEQLRTALVDVQRQLAETPDLPPSGVDEVLMVGGSTLLPEVPAVVDEAFPRAVVRHDAAYVFCSVALGAARYAGGTPVEDFVYHDYALAVQNERTHTVDYELLVPRRTRYPTAPDFTVRYYKDYPGMTEMRFSVCEVGRLGQAAVDWQGRSNGNRYWTPRNEDERPLVVELNPADPPVRLSPPGQGSGARLRVSYSINDDRWLCATVEDLARKQLLRENEPVVRLR